MANGVTKSLMKVINNQLPASTIRRHVKKISVETIVKRKKPLLSIRDKRNRLDFAINYKNWTVGDWNRVILSGETIINRLGPDRRKLVWKKPRERLSNRLAERILKTISISLVMSGCMS